MSTIDRQRIAAVKVIEALGYSFDGVEWSAPIYGAPLPNLHADTHCSYCAPTSSRKASRAMTTRRSRR
jgi:hypothetical protein